MKALITAGGKRIRLTPKESKGVDFSSKPIIILGANHTGTRVLIEILSILGSDPGPCDNEWKENVFFCDIHHRLINKIDNKDWTRTIFDLKFVKKYRDKLEYKNLVKKWLDDNLSEYYPKHKNHPWHWKCPTSALFLNTWLNIYPNAYYIHIIRDPIKVAESLLRRRQFYNVKYAIEFNNEMNLKIERLESKANNYIKVKYELLEKQINNLVNFLPFEVDKREISNALKIIDKSKKLIWNSNYTIKRNLWEIFLKSQILLYKIIKNKS